MKHKHPFPDEIIIAGAGLAGLTLALELSKHPEFEQTNISLIDRDQKDKNDRTWCFWARPEEDLPPVMHRQWNKALFYGHEFEAELQLAPFRYCMVRGIDFYQYAHELLGQKKNIRFVFDTIQQINAHDGLVQGEKAQYSADLIFNSALTNFDLSPTLEDLWPRQPFSARSDVAQAPKGYTYLLQHFKGWIIETEEDVFDPDLMTLMDYRPEQSNDTRFVYVLPLSRRQALVEYTVFSPKLCPPERYDEDLRAYIREYLGIENYSVIETEFGVIPMTDYPFYPEQQGKMISIGTAGGFVKASSGYAFLRTQRKLRDFVVNWRQTGQPDSAIMRSSPIFRSMDAIMLRVLRDRSYPGKRFFTDLFEKVPTEQVLRFLDEDASKMEILRIMRAAPMGIFMKKALEQLIFAPPVTAETP